MCWGDWKEYCVHAMWYRCNNDVMSMLYRCWQGQVRQGRVVTFSRSCSDTVLISVWFRCDIDAISLRYRCLIDVVPTWCRCDTIVTLMRYRCATAVTPMRYRRDAEMIRWYIVCMRRDTGVTTMLYRCDIDVVVLWYWCDIDMISLCCLLDNDVIPLWYWRSQPQSHTVYSEIIPLFCVRLRG